MEDDASTTKPNGFGQYGAPPAPSAVPQYGQVGPRPPVAPASSHITVPPRVQNAQPQPQPQPQTRREAVRGAEIAPAGTTQLRSHLVETSEDERRPAGGLRRVIYDLTSGRFVPRPSQHERLVIDLKRRIGQALDSARVYYIGVYSQKGGMGKTTTAVVIGALIASFRTDKILALDVNPDGGSLAIRVPETTSNTIIDLRDSLRSRDMTPMEFDAYVNHNPQTRLESIVMPPGKKPTEPLRADDFRGIAAALQGKYPYRVVVIDCGTDLSSPVMDGVIPQLDQLVVVASTNRDEALVTVGGLDALAKDGYGELTQNAVTLMVSKAPLAKASDAKERRDDETNAREIRSYFESCTRAVVDVPYDTHLRKGEVIDLEKLNEATRTAYMEATAEVIATLATRG